MGGLWGPWPLVRAEGFSWALLGLASPGPAEGGLRPSPQSRGSCQS